MWTTIAVTDLRNFLKQWIHEKQLTQREAAAEMGIATTTLNELLNKPEKQAAPTTLRKIATNLQMPLREIFELAGLRVEEPMPDEEALYGLTDEQRAFLRSLPPDKKAALIEMARRFLEGS